MARPIRIHLLGEPRVFRGTDEVRLPASRKTRALLAYLLVTGRPHRRERLCELFWDVPDDPRGSLRWALSKLRNVLDHPGPPRLIADRERVAIEAGDLDCDLLVLQALAANPATPLGDLARAAADLAEVAFDGLDLPALDTYQAWLTGERAEVEALRLIVYRRLVGHPEAKDGAIQRWARTWLTLDPTSAEAGSALARALQRSGRSAEAATLQTKFDRRRSEAGMPRHDLLAGDGTVPPLAPAEAPAAKRLLRHQSIGFCTAPDGVRIAYATVGTGPPLVKTANWLNHLELDWESPIWTDTFQALAARRTFIRYDERGNGLSDWNVPEISFEAFVRDLEAVVDARGLGRFPLLGMSQGCAVSVDYAVRHPERVSALIFIGGYAAGWRIGASADERERREAVLTLTRLGWGTNNAAYRHIFSQTFMPDAAPDALAWFDDFQRRTTSPENAVRFQDAFGNIDVRHLLGQVRAPTLVLHARDDQRISLAQGRELAAGIPDARLVTLDSRSHIILGHEPAWRVCMDEIERFLAEHGV